MVVLAREYLFLKAGHLVVVASKKGENITIWGTSNNIFQAVHLAELHPNEVENTTTQITSFVCTIDDFKQQMRQEFYVLAYCHYFWQ